MTHPGDDICDAIVAYLNAVQTNEDEPSPFLPFRFEASKPTDPNDELDKQPDSLRVLLWPHGETEIKTGRGGQVVETFSISMLVLRKLSDEFTREKLSGLARMIILKLRTQRMGCYVYSGREASGADLEQLHDFKRFTDAHILTYTGTA